jgi:2'-5' RNA ligase
VVQSVELLLDPAAEARIRHEWDLLFEAGLPTGRRAEPSPSHRPHITLYAATAIGAEAEVSLRPLMDGLRLRLHLGGCLFFGSGRGGFVLVRQVLVSAELLRLQGQVAAMCQGNDGGRGLDHFGPGHWTPHVTLARRMLPRQAGRALEILGHARELPVTVTQCRRWDGPAGAEWLL